MFDALRHARVDFEGFPETPFLWRKIKKKDKEEDKEEEESRYVSSSSQKGILFLTALH